MTKKAEPAVKLKKLDLISSAPPRRGSSKPLPPVVEDERKSRCKNCGREGTLVTRVSCTECGFTDKPV